jgi:cation transport protein ChaC
LALTREDIRNGIIQKFVAEAGPWIDPLPEEEREASRLAMMAERAPDEDIWVFGYGSLIWNPAFYFDEQRVGRLYGYHRRFCMQIFSGRGSAKQPGLMLALDRGGSCSGVVFRISREQADEELGIIWQREMISGSYMPRWLEVRTPAGPVQAITFVVNRAHNRYIGELPESEVVETLAAAKGPLGRSCDYLYNTAAHLEAMGIADRNLKRLSRQVARLQGLGGPPGLAELNENTADSEIESP